VTASAEPPAASAPPSLPEVLPPTIPQPLAPATTSPPAEADGAAPSAFPVPVESVGFVPPPPPPS
jgi:hypothetical protein